MRLKLPQLKLGEQLQEFDHWITQSLGEIIGKRLKAGQVKGSLLVPGFGQNFGISLSELADTVLPQAGLFGHEWAKNGQVLRDIEFLAKKGWLEQR